MCGIFALLSRNINNSYKMDIIEKNFMKGQSRGPENSKFQKINSNLILGFHRLAINGLDEISNQPIVDDGIYLICNGEIYNYKSIYKYLSYEPQTNSDCEAIICLYKAYGIEYTIQNLDGVFSFLLYDSKKNIGYVARDPFGIRPLYYGLDGKNIYFSSLLKQISDLCNECFNFPSGNYLTFSHNENSLHVSPIIKYTTFTYNNTISNRILYDLNYCYNVIYDSLFEAVKKRVFAMDTNLACLLSGGLDSSLISAMVAKFVPKGQLQTYSIGMTGGTDLYYAKMVSNHICSNHTEIVLTEFEFFDAIKEVIYNIESYDTTTVRASVGNYLVSKYIKNNSDAKVIFNGDGSDELTGGYMYFHNCPSNIEFDHECKRLLSDIQYFDVLRSDRSISCHGLEARTPFLDRSFVHQYLSLPIEYRNFNNCKQIEKWLLRKSIEIMDNNLLPKEVLWRNKEAFSDGVSSQNRSWFEIIQEKLDDIYTDEKFEEKKNLFTFNTPQTKEQLYYRELFESFYQGKENVIPYFWMPKYNQATDSSARSLEIYKKKNNLESNIEE